MLAQKEKAFIVYRTKIISSNVEKLFGNFIEYLEQTRIFMPYMNQINDQDITIAEIGPREENSTYFLTNNNERIQISFKLIDNSLTVEMDAKNKSIKKYKKLLTPYIIRSLKKALSQTSEIAQII